MHAPRYPFWEVGLVIGIISKSSTAETLLNNLSEADFDLKDVSVMMRDQKARDAIAEDAGPFKGLALVDLVNRLVQVGLSKPDAQKYADAVAQGKVLIAIATPRESESAASEMLQDASAELIKVARQ